MFQRQFLLARHYFSGAFINKRFIPARVEDTASGITLKTYEPHFTYRLLSETNPHNWKNFPVIRGFKHLIAKTSLNVWGMHFMISPAGNIVMNSKGFNSTEHVNFSREEGNKVFMPTTTIYAMPDILYSINQAGWDEFISRLPAQDVAKQLNLSQHRHLWPAYNYAVEVDDARRKYRATYFGEFHFLLSFIPFYAFNTNSSALGHIVLTEEKIKKVLNVIDQNQSPVGIFLEILKLPNHSFINKFAHSPTWYYLSKISEFIVDKAIYVPGKINLLKLNEFVAALPSSKKNPVEFQLMVRECENLKLIFERSRISGILSFQSSFFYQKRLNFSEVTQLQIQLSETNDYIEKLMENLVFPEIVRQMLNLADCGTRLSNIKEVIAVATQITRTHILDHTNQKSLQSLVDRWHRNLTVVENLMPLKIDIACKQWHGLFSEITMRNVTFTCLTTDEQIKNEAAILEHCVGGYGRKCKRGECHIVCVISEFGERATLELKPEKGAFTIGQFKGRKNGFPSAHMLAAGNQLVTAINTGQIKLNPLRGGIATLSSASASAPNLAILAQAYEVYPYDFNDLEIQEKIHAAFNNNKLLPPGFRASSYAEMLVVTKIREIIREYLNGDALASEPNRPR